MGSKRGKVVLVKGLSEDELQHMDPGKYGELLFKRLLERDVQKGGFFMDITGLPGSGKTALMLRLAHLFLMRTDDKVFWREPLDVPCQFIRLPQKYWHILVEDTMEIYVYDIKSEKILEDKEVEGIIKKFSDFDELYGLASNKKLNTVYFENEKKWFDFLRYLMEKPGWHSIFWDEYEDLCPAYARDEDWREIKWFAENVKQVRKSRINLIANSQNKFDVDFRIRSKAMFYAYLRGARVDKESPIFPAATHTLEIGQIFLDYMHSLFGTIYVSEPYLPEREWIIKKVEVTKTEENNKIKIS